MARQYFNSQLADSAIVTASTGSITTLTGIFTPQQANQFFPMGYGVSAPFAGQVFRFKMGGIMTTNASASTLVVTPVFGPSSAQSGLTGAVSLGASAAQTVVASLTNSPWYMSGVIGFRLISAAATTSTAWCSGAFHCQGTLATAGAGCVIPFGSTAAISVDTTGLGAAGSFGAINIGITFSVAGTVQAAWTSWDSGN